MAKEKKTIYYTDPLNDDFSPAHLTKQHLKEDYVYYRGNIFYRVISAIVYFGIALPILWLVGKLWRGVRVKGKKRLKKALKGKGAFFYGNHTHFVDAFLVQAYLTPSRRTYIIAGREALDLKGLVWLMKLVGILPIPETIGQTAKFLNTIETLNKKKYNISIFPEAHIWPFYTGIRPFIASSFVYPAKHNAPAVPFCVTYRRRKIFKSLPPLMTVHVGPIIYPDLTLDMKERVHKMRDEAYSFMVETASQPDNYEHIRYLRKEGDV